MPTYSINVTIDVVDQDTNEVKQTIVQVPVIETIRLARAAIFKIDEGTSLVGTVQASGGVSRSYAITGGEDAALFNIDAATGVLTFLSVPDYENPADANTNNDYRLEVTVSDTVVGSKTQKVGVHVLPLNDNAPVFLSDNLITMDAEETFVVQVRATDADQEPHVSHVRLIYAIAGGANANLFTIHMNTGRLEFIDEAVAGAYSVQVSASDGELTSAQTISITVEAIENIQYDSDTGTIDQVVEGAANGTYVGITVASNMTNAVMTMLTQEEADAFEVHPTTGAITVKDGTRIVYAPPPITPAQSDSDASPNRVVEGAAQGTYTGLTASTNLTNPVFSVLTQQIAGAFSVNPATGAVNVDDGSLLVYQAPSVGFNRVASLALVSPAAQTGPQVFGHAFKRGDVPAGHVVTTDAGLTQGDILTTWSDGSAKTAVIAVSDTWINGSNNLEIGYDGVGPAGSNVTEADITASGHTAVVNFSNGVTGSVSLANLIGQVSNGTKGSPGLMRNRINGPLYSEFLYYSQVGTDAHLSVWFQVRIFNDGKMRVRVTIENGWLNVAGPTSKFYDVTIVIDGQTVETKTSIEHLHHQRPSRAFWAGASVQDARPEHDLEYFRDTKLIPNYIGRFGDVLLDGLGADYGTANTWFSQNGYPPTMGAGGYDESIGVLPHWDVAATTTKDARAWEAMLANANTSGAFGIHLRDESTLEVPVVTDYTDLAYDSNEAIKTNGNAANNTPEPTPVWPTGWRKWESSHHPAPPYIAALLTGDDHYVEEVSMIAAACVLSVAQGVAGREGGSKVIELNTQERRAAWMTRTIAMAACIVPGATGDAFKASTQETVDYLYNLNIAGTTYGGRWVNDMGVYTNQVNYIDRTKYPTQDGFWVPWQHNYIVLALSLAADMELGINNIETVRNHGYKLAVGLTGDPANYNPQRAAQYSWPVGANRPQGEDLSTFDPGFFTSFSQAKAALKTAYPAIDETVTPGGVLYELFNTNNEISGTHWHESSGAIELYMTLSYALDNGVPGAEDAFKNFSELSTNVARIPSNWIDSTFRPPIWGAGPRTGLAVAPPAWLTAPLNQWTSVSGTRLQDAFTGLGGLIIPETNGGKSYPDNRPLAYGGAVLAGRKIYILRGGGHADGNYSCDYMLDLDDVASGWIRLSEPVSPVTRDVSHYDDGNTPSRQPTNRHNYYDSFWCPSVNRLINVSAVAVYGQGGVHLDNVDAMNPDNNLWDPAQTYVNSGISMKPGAGMVQLPDESIYVFNKQNTQLRKFNPQQNAWINVGTNTLDGNQDRSECGVCFDSTRGRIFALRRGGSTCITVDPDTGVTTTHNLSGPQLPVAITTLLYVPAMDTIFCVGGVGTDNNLYTINPATFAVAPHSTTGTGPTINLPYKQIMYSEDLGCLLYVQGNPNDLKYLKIHN